MSKIKRLFLFALPALCLVLMGQGTGPTVFTPFLTVSPGNLTVTDGVTSVQNLTVNGTCTGCPTSAPGGANGQVQYNNNGAFAGDSGLTYVPATDTLSTGALSVSSGATIAGDLGLTGNMTATGTVTANLFSGSLTAGGANTQIQFNNAGVISGDAGLTYNSTNDVLTATGGVVGTGGTNVGNRLSASTQSPTSLSANTNDWALTPVPIVLISSSAAVNVTGISASTANADSFSLGNNVLLNLINTSANQITFTNEDSNSSAANRFTLPYGASYVIGTGESVQFYYNSSATRWYVANAKQISAQTNGTFNIDFTVGCTTTFSTGAHRYAKRGNDVWLTLIGGGTCTSNATTFTAPASTLPAAITPDGTICTRIRGTDNGAAMEILLCLTSAGGVQLSTCNANGACSASGWTNSGTKGFTGQNVTFAYNVDSNGTPSGGGN